MGLCVAIAGVAASVAIVATTRLAAGPAPTYVIAAQPPPVAVTAPPVVAPPVEAEAAGRSVLVRVDVTPSNARVYCDDILLEASAPLSIARDGRSHVVRAEALGFKTRRTSFVATSDVTLVIALERLLERKAAASAPADPTPISPPSTPVAP